LTWFAASAGTFLPPASPQTSLVEKAEWGDPDYYRGYRYGYYRGCRFWCYECDRQWGWNSWEYLLCLRRHGCGGDLYRDRYRNYYRGGRYYDYRY